MHGEQINKKLTMEGGNSKNVASIAFLCCFHSIWFIQIFFLVVNIFYDV